MPNAGLPDNAMKHTALTEKLLLPLLLAAALALAACGNGQAGANGDNGEEDEETVRIPVEVVAVETGTVTAFYSTTATLEADREARVVPRLGGTIVELLVEEGDQVEQGQVLARIDDARYRLELMQAQANMSRLRQEYNRNQEMYRQDLISAETFERLKFEYEAQKAQFELAELELSYTDITAPITGVVSERMIKVGNTVNTQDPVFVITLLDPLLATLHVPEREMSRLEVGQQAALHADALAGDRFEGRIARISPVVDADTGTFRVTVEVRDESGRLKPGMFGRVRIVHDTREQALLVPVQAVMIEDSRVTVFVVEDDKVERRNVVLGYRNNGDYEIVEGLEQGERVVVTGQASLRDGSTVSVIGEDTAPVQAEVAE